MVKITQKKIPFKGKIYKYTTPANLATKLNVSVTTATNFIENQKGQILIRTSDGLFGKIKPSSANAMKRLEKFGINNISNAKLLNGTTLTRENNKNQEIKINLSKRKITGGNIRRALIRIKLTLQISEGDTVRTYTMPYSGPLAGLNKAIDEEVTARVKLINEAVGISIKINEGMTIEEIKKRSYVKIESVEVDVISEFTKQSFQYDGEEVSLERDQPINITSKYNVDMNEGFGCVDNMLYNILGLKSSFGKSATRKQLIEFVGKKARIQVYAIDGSLLYDNEVNSNKTLSFIDYQKHCYPIINGKLTKKKQKEITTIKYRNCNVEICKQLKKGVFPFDIEMDFSKEPSILSFVADEVKYINNDVHKKMVDLANDHGLTCTIKDNVRMTDIFKLLEPKHNITANSFFPLHFTKPAYNYTTDLKINNSKKISVIDCNKAYTSALYTLPFLISVDIRSMKSGPCTTPTEIIEHNLYIAEAIGSLDVTEEVLMPCKNIYSGYHIIYCAQEGINIKIYEEIACEKHKNSYSTLIDELREMVDNDEFKDIMNISIGRFNTDEKINETHNIVGIFNNEEIDGYDGDKIKISNEYSVLMDDYKNVTISNVYNKKPINFQIKDYHNMAMYKKIKQMKLKAADIIHIKTDCIAYYGDLPDDLNAELCGWKAIPYKEMGQASKQYPQCQETFFMPKPNNNKLYNCNAGWGKTYTIMNKLIKNIKNYEILTPSHKTCEIYKKNGLNCNVIQVYEHNGKMPTADNIIIDEIGLMGKKAHDLIYKLVCTNKRIIAYGDFNQLPPVCEEKYLQYFNSKLYLDMIFHKQYNTFANYRNNFTQEYYNDLINENIDYAAEVLKHSTKKYSKADIIITYTKDERDKYNNMMMKKHDLKFGDVGLNVICKTNELKAKNIFNAANFTITHKTTDKVTLDDKITITRKQLERNFIPYYATTLYGFQGDECASYFYPEDEIHMIKNGKFAYTLISRLKQQITKPEITTEEAENDKITDPQFIISFD